MEFSTDGVQPARRKGAPPTSGFEASPIARVIAIAAVAMFLMSAGRLNPEQEQRAQSQTHVEAAAKGAPDSKDHIAMREEQSAKTNVDTAGSDRKQQMNDDSIRLLKLASDLKAEVDKSNKDILSVGVIRKADEIEKLAKNVREKLKHSMN